MKITKKNGKTIGSQTKHFNMDIRKIVNNNVNKLLKEEDATFEGWVNVKIDDQVKDRVETLMHGLGFGDGNLEEKLDFLSNPLSFDFGDSLGETIRSKISAVIILQYLNEIKNRFHPASSGFLFESFMAGLLGGRVETGNRAIDVFDDEEYGYQLKFYADSDGKQLKALPYKEDEDGNPLVELPHWIIVGLKSGGGDISIYIMDYFDFYEKLRPNKEGVLYMNIGDFKREGELIGYLRLSEIEQLSRQINENLMSSVTSLWENISQLHFNVESMLTGVDNSGNKVSAIESAVKALNNTSEIDSTIDMIHTEFTKNT